MTQSFPFQPPLRCPDCSAELSPALLACPRCRRLVHRDRLNQLAAWASQAQAAGDVSSALGAWREALELLPRDSKQYLTISQTVSALSREADARGLRPQPPPSAPPPPGRPGPNGHAPGAKSTHRATAAGAIGAAVLFLLTKAKLLLLGLTKASTFFSMLVTIGAYWALYGWKFAIGLVLSIYVHEMGHVAMLTRYGMKATAPMFIPGLGALIRLQQHPADPREDARIGLAGPIWGLGAAVVCSVVWLGTKWPAWAAIASVGAWVNLFNLLPVWQLDGGRGFRALTTVQRLIVIGVMGGMFWLTRENLLILLMIAGGLRVVGEHRTGEAREGDTTALVQFAFLVVTLSLLAKIPVPGAGL